jgi:hypothetical protein
VSYILVYTVLPILRLIEHQLDLPSFLKNSYIILYYSSLHSSLLQPINSILYKGFYTYYLVLMVLWPQAHIQYMESYMWNYHVESLCGIIMWYLESSAT